MTKLLTVYYNRDMRLRTPPPHRFSRTVSTVSLRRVGQGRARLPKEKEGIPPETKTNYHWSKPAKNMILDITTLSAVRRERLRLALELNRSYYGDAVGIRSVNRGYYNQEQQHWTFEFVGNDGKVYTYGIFKNELERDVAKVEVPETSPESLIETIETEVRKYDKTIFCLRDKKRSHVVTFTTLVRGVRLDWKFVQYGDKLIFASHSVDGFYINIDRKVNDTNSAMRVVNKMLSDIVIAEGMRAYA